MSNEIPSRFAIAFERRFLSAKQALLRVWMKVTGNSRPSSYPYISGDSLRALADHIHDETASLVPENVQRGDIVFVANPHIYDYWKTIHPKISHPYILITNNGDDNADGSLSPYIDDKIIRWYAQSVLVEHPKLTPTPVGLENLFRYQIGIGYQTGNVSFYRRMQRRLKKHLITRKPRIFYQFKVRTNPKDRQPALDYWSKHGLAETVAHKLSPLSYLKKLSGYMFVVSPPGNSEDCHRTWEALYLGVVPIVKDCVATRSFAALDLPLWVVRDWHELDGLTEDDLVKKYDALMKKADWEPAYMDYWIGRIRKDQTMIKDQKGSLSILLSSDLTSR